MLCLVCEQTIPLRRRLAGSPFCSPGPAEQHARTQSAPAPLPAQFARTSPACALAEGGRSDSSAFHTPIPRFCDVILSRPNRNRRLTLAAAGALNEAGWPDADPPQPGHAIGERLGARNRLHLALVYSSSLDTARRLPAAASCGGAQAVPPSPAQARSAGAILKVTPADALPRSRFAPPGGLKKASLGKNLDTPQEQQPAPRVRFPQTASLSFALKPADRQFTQHLAIPELRARRAVSLQSPKPGSVSAVPRSAAAPLSPGLRLSALEFAQLPTALPLAGDVVESLQPADPQPELTRSTAAPSAPAILLPKRAVRAPRALFPTTWGADGLPPCPS